MEAALVGSERIEEEREPQQSLGMWRKRSGDAQPNDPAQQPSANVQQLHFVARDETQFAQLWIAFGKQGQVWDVTIAEQP